MSLWSEELSWMASLRRDLNTLVFSIDRTNRIKYAVLEMLYFKFEYQELFIPDEIGDFNSIKKQR